MTKHRRCLPEVEISHAEDRQSRLTPIRSTSRGLFAGQAVARSVLKLVRPDSK